MPPAKPKRKIGLIIGITLLVLIIVYCGAVQFIAFPTLSAVVQAPSTTIGGVANVAWPSNGQAAFGVNGYGVLAESANQKSAPIASIAKLVLALAVLQQKPLLIGQNGPTLVITQSDVNLYSSYLAQNGSVVPVQVGEQLTEYQLLQALLLPSGDNIADTMADWMFGSTGAYLTSANQMLRNWGLTQSFLADASGLSPQTVSSAHDVALLGQKVLAQPVLASIVSQPSVVLPVAGAEKNVDSILGQGGIIGIKTGNTDQAGGCFVFAAKTTISGQETTVIGAILGDTSLSGVLADTLSFLSTNSSALSYQKIFPVGQTVGSYPLPWGGSVPVVSAQAVSGYVANNQKITSTVLLKPMMLRLAKGNQVGTLTVQDGSNDITVPAVLSETIARPPIWWRIIHP